MIELHGNRTANSQKILIFFEEAGLEYRHVHYDMMKGEHLVPEFRKLNPNFKLPVIVDYDPEDGAGPLTVFESGAILLYLADKIGQFLPTDPRGRSDVTQWLVWQVANLGPMLGQAGHFIRYAPEGEAYGIGRYSQEARRLLNVMEGRLREVEFLAGEYSIADMACWPWVQTVGVIGFELSDFPAVERWVSQLQSRPAYQRMLAGDGAIPPELLRPRVTMTAEQWSVTFGDRMLEAAKPAAT